MVSSGNGTNSRAFNVEDPFTTEAIFRLNGLDNGLRKLVKVAAFNSMGVGPYSAPESSIELNKLPSLYFNEYYDTKEVSGAQYTWLIALLGSVAFMLILVSFVMIYYRKKPKYLAANTSDSDNYHCTLKAAASTADSTSGAVLSQSGGPLWIDRYFEKQETDRKLLSMSATMPNVKDGANEYAYIDNNEATAAQVTQNNRHSLSTFGGISGGPSPFPVPVVVTSTSIMQQQPLITEPEPYATTDILRAEKEKLQQHHHHYAVNIDVLSTVLLIAYTYTQLCLHLF